MDRSLLFFLFQFLMSLFICLFCMCMIIKGGDMAVFLPIMTGTAGYWMPQPTIPSKPATDLTTPLLPDPAKALAPALAVAVAAKV